MPYMHIHDAVAFFARLLECQEKLENGEILLASTDGATSHQELHAVATACHFGERIRPVRLPRPACLLGIWLMDSLGRAAGRRPFERPWMAKCIDRRLAVDASRTRARLEWEPRERLGICRRLPFLIQNQKAHLAEWLKKNQVAAKRTRMLPSATIHGLLAAHQGEISSRLRKYLEDPARRTRFSAYLDCSTTHLEERHRLPQEQLMCAVRTGDKAVLMNYCRHMGPSAGGARVDPCGSSGRLSSRCRGSALPS